MKGLSRSDLLNHAGKVKTWKRHLKQVTRVENGVEYTSPEYIYYVGRAGKITVDVAHRLRDSPGDDLSDYFISAEAEGVLLGFAQDSQLGGDMKSLYEKIKE